MDLENYSRSLSQMVRHEIYRDCNMACSDDTTATPLKECVINCAAKQAKLLTAFDKTIKLELPKLQDISRIQ